MTIIFPNKEVNERVTDIDGRDFNDRLRSTFNII